MLIAFADPNTESPLARDLWRVFILGIFPAALISGLARWLVERRRGKAQFAGAWASVMWAKLLFQLALLGTLPTLALAALLAWLAGGPADELFRATVMLLIAGTAVAITASLVANLLNLLSPGPRAS